MMRRDSPEFVNALVWKLKVLGAPKARFGAVGFLLKHVGIPAGSAPDYLDHG